MSMCCSREVGRRVGVVMSRLKACEGHVDWCCVFDANGEVLC